ncbi:MAG: ATP12 family protein [Pseudomonadota bacterium]
MKRFYENVAVAAEADGHRILLDGRPVNSPARRVLALPYAALAEAVAEEWRAQGETIERSAMALTKLVSTALDRMPDLREAAIEEVLGYGETDLVCYRAEDPATLVERQRQSWQPWLEWLSAVHDVRLAVTETMLHVPQPREALDQLRRVVERVDDWQLVGLHAATTGLGSVVLGLALLEGRISAEDAVAASLLDELFEMETWGHEQEAERRHQQLRHDLAAAERFLACLRNS